MKTLLLLFPFFLLLRFPGPEQKKRTPEPASKIIPAAERLDLYLPLLKGKSVAIFANNTTMVGNTHLVDTLQKLGITIIKIFSPEHGFRGNADAGAKVESALDSATGVNVISLYGKKRKPSAEDLRDVDIMVFDIQDVGVRFYTYISSMEAYLESAIENHKPLIILDRPNPNGFYVDGPVLQKKFRSFVGMQPVPIVYGMTIGEYAKMLMGENWLDPSVIPLISKANVKIIPCKNYTHDSKYILPEKPSPNLPNIQSIYCYPSTCFFEGTVLSEGRGTDKPFQVFGHPSLPSTLFSFTPHSQPGATSPKFKEKRCYGWNVGGTPQQVRNRIHCRIQLKWLMEAYRLFPVKDSFFLHNQHFNRLAGNDELMKQIISGKTEKEIRASWEPELSHFKEIRKKYLLYKDFKKS